MTSGLSPTLQRVLDGDLCAGCGLCAGVSDGAVILQTQEPGYTRPRQLRPLTATAEAKIAAACPGSVIAPWPQECHPYWGPATRVLTGHATDPLTRHAGASGGALSALASFAIESGLVDGVVHVEADPDRPTRNRTCVSTSVLEVVGAAGSRYAASSPLEAIDALLGDARRFAFIGKPCDVSALRHLGGEDDRVTARFPIMFSFFCGGVPSHAGADRIISAMGMSPSSVKRFRYRGNGWPGKTVAEAADGRAGTMNYADSWGAHLSKEVQFRCKICPDAVGGVADIAAADAWYGGEAGYPQFEEQDGRSLIMVRTAVGQDLIARCESAGRLVTQALDINEIDLMQPAQANRKRSVAARVAAIRSTVQPSPRMTGLKVAKAARQSNLRDLLRNYLGTMRRIIQGRR